jgi:GTP-binding protein
MKFVDSCEVTVSGGKGGNGSIAFRREKFVPFGGPSGGDGGRGGSVIFTTDPGMSTLLDLTHARVLRAEAGENGMGSDCYGKGGEDLVVRVPVGTQVFDSLTGNLLFDLDAPNTRTVVAKGGRGGRGNIHFATSQDRAPRRAEPGDAGDERKVRLELKVIADVGLLGFPNVGKSTFIRAISHAKPKVADYPFTTLTPHLGVVSIGEEASFVMADIPGLIPGAAEGAGLGIRFLKHVERTRALLHLVTLDHGEGRDPLGDWTALNDELAKFDPELAKRPQIVAMSKADLPEVQEAYAREKPRFAKKKVDLRLVSAATGAGVRELLIALYQLVRQARGEIPAEESADEPESPALRGTAKEEKGDEAKETAPAAKAKERSAPRAKARERTAPAAKAKKKAAPTARAKKSAKAKKPTPKAKTAKKKPKARRA